MLGRKSYTQEEVDHGKAAVAAQLAVYKTLVTAMASETKRQSARADFERQFFNNLTLALDHYYVYRLPRGDG